MATILTAASLGVNVLETLELAINFQTEPLPEVVMWVLEKSDYRLTREVKLILRLFHAPECMFDSAVGVLAEVAKRMWLENIFYDNKIDLLDGMLEALGTNRPTHLVAVAFSGVTEQKLLLAPSISRAISERVRLWKERKLGRAGIVVPPKFRTED